MTIDTSREAVGRILEGVTRLYRIEPDGRVFSIGHNWRGYGDREIKPIINSHGYLAVRVSVEGKRKNVPVHRLVALVHLPPRPSMSHEIRHMDGNRLNPHADNLAWGTRSENAKDRARHGTEKAKINAAKSIAKRSGENCATSKLTNAEAAEIRRRFKSGETAKQISRDFNRVSYWAVNHAAIGKTFKVLNGQ